MRALFLLLLLSCSLDVLYAQSNHDFYDYNYNTGDTSIEITVSPVYRHYAYDDFPCMTAENRRGYLHSVDTSITDSIQQLFENLASPFVGKDIAENTFIERMHAYNEEEPFFLDSANHAYMKINHPECLELHYSFTCYFRFSNGIYFPYEIYFDDNGQAIHTSSILKTLKSLKTHDLFSPQKAYHKMKNDHYFEEEQIRKFFTLNYSENLERFYYEIEATDGKVKDETKHTYTLLKKHLFIDAITGAVLWRTKVEHFHESIGCIVNHEITYPQNTLTAN